MATCYKPSLVTGSELIKSLTQALGLPNNITSLNLHADHQSLVTVDLTFDLDKDQKEGLVNVLSGKYQLVKVKDSANA